jgi:hypothetical protein
MKKPETTYWFWVNSLRHLLSVKLLLFIWKGWREVRKIQFGWDLNIRLLHSNVWKEAQEVGYREASDTHLAQQNLTSQNLFIPKVVACLNSNRICARERNYAWNSLKLDTFKTIQFHV